MPVVKITTNIYKQSVYDERLSSLITLLGKKLVVKEESLNFFWSTGATEKSEGKTGN